MGSSSNPQMYHVIQEFNDDDKNVYSYLSEKEIQEKYKLNIAEKFGRVVRQDIFKP
jgi:heat shock protein HspQ